jgi:hypothetical protein
MPELLGGEPATGHFGIAVYNPRVAAITRPNCEKAPSPGCYHSDVGAHRDEDGSYGGIYSVSAGVGQSRTGIGRQLRA